jgi:hypothetical protein
METTIEMIWVYTTTWDNVIPNGLKINYIIK